MVVEHHRRGPASGYFGVVAFHRKFLLAIILPNFVRAYIQAHHGAQPPWICVMEEITPERLGNVGLIAIFMFIIGVAFLAKGKGYSGIFRLFGFLFGIGLLIVLV
jgi:hypothetical protein